MVETLILAGLNAGVIGSAGAAVAIGQATSLIGVASTAFGAVGSVMGGQQQAAVSAAQARQEMLSARQEELKGREEGDKIRRALSVSLASQNAIFSARGISTAGGTPLTLAGVSSTAAARDIETAQFNAGQAAASRRSQAAQFGIEGRAARTAGFTNAATSLFGAKDQFGSLLR